MSLRRDNQSYFPMLPISFSEPAPVGAGFAAPNGCPLESVTGNWMMKVVP